MSTVSTFVCALAAITALAASWLLLKRRARFAYLPAALRPLETRDTGSVKGVRFAALDGTLLDAWMFTPNTPCPPVVLMAPGLGGTKDGFLEPIAWSFVARGVAVVLFDYRCFGGSLGQPRHWVDPVRHREDYQAALRFVNELGRSGELDATRIAVWGSSFSGGTAIELAAQEPRISAVVVQCPFLETPPELEPKGFTLARFIFWTTLDMLGVFPPIYVPMFGRPGEWAFALSRENPSVDDFGGALGAEFWRRLPKPGLGGWENRMLARMLASIDKFTPAKHVNQVRCPILFVAARDDDMVPLGYVERAHATAASPLSELAVFEGGHFGLYLGATQAASAERQATFLAQHLRSQPAT